MTDKILYRVLCDENEEVARIFFEVMETGEQIEGSHQIQKWVNSLFEENEKLKSENKRLTDKLNQTALELVDGYISQGKATEISEMSYREFLDYRAKNGKPMELQK